MKNSLDVRCRYVAADIEQMELDAALASAWTVCNASRADRNMRSSLAATMSSPLRLANSGGRRAVRRGNGA